MRAVVAVVVVLGEIGLAWVVSTRSPVSEGDVNPRKPGLARIGDGDSDHPPVREDEASARGGAVGPASNDLGTPMVDTVRFFDAETGLPAELHGALTVRRLETTSDVNSRPVMSLEAQWVEARLENLETGRYVFEVISDEWAVDEREDGGFYCLPTTYIVPRTIPSCDEA